MIAPKMIDWLLGARSKTEAASHPTVEVGGRLLPVAIRRLDSARRMTMRLSPDGSEVRVSVPRWCRSAEALEFARTKAAWLSAQGAALAPAAEIADGAVVMFEGEALTLRHDPAAPRKIARDGDTLLAGGPATSLKSRLARWLEAEALALMQADLAEYCARAAQPCPPLKLSRAQRRWGSCAHPDSTGGGTIRLNWRLVMAPRAVRRSVVAHEVAHLLHFDHSPAFHAALAALYEGDLAAANRWLKREGRSLYRLLG